MNIQTRSTPAQGLPDYSELSHGVCRRLWTVHDLERMAAIGILHEDDHTELIHGRVIVKDPRPDGSKTFPPPVPWPDDLPPDLAEGVHGRRWTADELERLTRAQIIGRNERVELVGGEIVTMAAKGARHEILRNDLFAQWVRQLPNDLKLRSETPLRLAPREEPEPDLILHPTSISLPDVRGDTVLLVVEVSDWSLSYDLEVKSLLYASIGVREYWVIDAKTLTTTVFQRPGSGTTGYASRHEAPGSIQVVPAAAPALAIRLADLSLD